MCAKVKRRCSARLRFISSLRKSKGEWRGELGGEAQDDILGDPQGEQDVWGFNWKAVGLQTASLVACWGGSLMVLFPAAFWVQRQSPVLPSPNSSFLSEEIHKGILTLPCIHSSDFQECSSFSFSEDRYKSIWTQAAVQLVNEPPSAPGCVYTALSPG